MKKLSVHAEQCAVCTGSAGDPWGEGHMVGEGLWGLAGSRPGSVILRPALPGQGALFQVLTEAGETHRFVLPGFLHAHE